MNTMTTDEYRKAIKAQNARIERTFRKAHKSMIEKNGGKLLGFILVEKDGVQ